MGKGPGGWRLALPEGLFVLVRHSFAVAYSERRRTKAEDILARWRQAGLAAASQVEVTVTRPAVEVLAFTPLAVSRFIPAIRDEISTWPRVGRGQARGLNTAPGAPAVIAKSPLSAPVGSAPSQPVLRTTAPLRNNPDDALVAVVAWVQANRMALRAAERNELGRWEATSRGVRVLLIRSNHTMRILFSGRFDVRAVLTAWRDQGTIVALPNRFTVYMRTRNSERGNRGTGRTFMAFSWEALERAGLQRSGSVLR